jgi:DNA-directed RNA polymerase subunit RPC12/RpoP
LVERNWWGNILYLLGVQWVVYDTNARRWRQRKLSPSVPTPITNLFRATLDTVKSAIAQHEPRFLGTPMRDDPKAIAAASTADEQLQVILEEGGFRKARRRMLDWLIPTGNAFVEVVWDSSPETGMDEIPYEKCTQCNTEFMPDQIDPTNPACPSCGNKILVDSETMAVSVPRGSIRFDTHSPFEVYLDPAIDELEENPFILLVESYTKEQVAMQWSVDVESDYEYAGTGQMFKENAATLASPGIALPLGALSAQDRMNRITVYRAFIKHHKEYPDGAYLVMTAAGKMLERVAPFPWQRKVTGKKFYPMVMFKFGEIGGRAWGYTPADDLLPKQYQLNKAESLFTLIMARMANPVWLIPSNSNPTRITGEIGLQIEYTPGAGGIGPQRVPGAEAPQSLVKYIADIRNAFDELSGAFSAVRGRQVGTRTPASTVQQLTERGFGRWATVFDQLEEGYEDLARISLEVWRQNANSPRVKAVKNAIGGWSFQEFMAADWDDGVDIQVEAGSARPKTQMQKLQTYLYLAQAGILNLADAAQKIKILEDVGMSNLLPGVQEDTKAAYKENADFMQWAQQATQAIMNSNIMTAEGQQAAQAPMADQPIMVHPLVDEHSLHFLTHRRLCLTEEFKALPDQIQNIMFQHMLQHKQDQQMSMMVPQAPSPPAPGMSSGAVQSGPNQPAGPQTA